MRAASLVVLVTFALSCVPHAVAEDEAPAKTAAQRFAEKVRMLPAPAEKNSFDAVGRVFMGKMDLGSFRLSAEAVSLDGKTVWKCRDSGDLAFGENTAEYETVAYLDARLECISGTERDTKSGDTSEAEWAQGETGVVLTKKSGGTSETTTLTRKGGLCSVAALILFCRSALSSEESYECWFFDADPDEGTEHFQKGEISVKGPDKWRERDVLTVGVKRGKQTVSLAFAKEGHEFLGLDLTDASGLRMTLVVGAKAAPEAVAEDDFVPPADTPKSAAFIAALAFGTRNAELLDKIVHWKTVHEELMRSNPTSKATLEQFRSRVLARIGNGKSKSDRKTVIFGIRTVESDVKVTMKGTDRATVSFPKTFKSLELEVGKVDGHWYLVRFPGT